MNPLFDNDQALRYVDLLREIVRSPPSDRMMDESLVKMFDEFCAAGDFSSPAVWNHFKKALDFTVRYSLGSRFVVQLLDLEPFYEPPAGGYAQRDGSIHRAPWRLEAERSGGT